LLPTLSLSNSFTSDGTWISVFSPSGVLTVTLRALLSITVTTAVACVVSVFVVVPPPRSVVVQREHRQRNDFHRNPECRVA